MDQLVNLVLAINKAHRTSERALDYTYIMHMHLQYMYIQM